MKKSETGVADTDTHVAGAAELIREALVGGRNYVLMIQPKIVDKPDETTIVIRTSLTPEGLDTFLEGLKIGPAPDVEVEETQH